LILEIRASDEDRQRVVDLLQQHTSTGRLSLDEFTERVDVAYKAVTLGDLAVVTRDLPVIQAEPRPVRRDLLLLFAIAAVTLLLLGLYMAVTRG
jgi:hypothetical protein